MHESFWQNSILITCFCCWSLVIFMFIAPTVRCGKRICKDLKSWSVFVPTDRKAVAQAVRVILLLLWIWIFFTLSVLSFHSDVQNESDIVLAAVVFPSDWVVWPAVLPDIFWFKGELSREQLKHQVSKVAIKAKF